MHKIVIQITSRPATSLELGPVYDMEYYYAHYGWNWINPLAHLAAVPHDLYAWGVGRHVLSWNGYVMVGQSPKIGYADTPNKNGPTYVNLAKMTELIMRTKNLENPGDWTIAWANLILHETTGPARTLGAMGSLRIVCFNAISSLC